MLFQILILYNHKKYFRMKIQESSVLNETTAVVRFRNGVLHLIHQKGVFKTPFFEEVPNCFFKEILVPEIRG